MGASSIVWHTHSEVEQHIVIIPLVKSHLNFYIHIHNFSVSQFCIGIFIKMLRNTFMTSPVLSIFPILRFNHFCILCHDFWTNQGLDPSNISKFNVPVKKVLTNCTDYSANFSNFLSSLRGLVIIRCKNQ